MSQLRRYAINVRGIVQGVGFRPFVHRLASRHRLGGFVRNRSGGVLIEVEGDPDRLDAFLEDLAAMPQQPADFEDVSIARRHPAGEELFRIDDSEPASDDAAVYFSPDLATCEACLRELFDPEDRRFRYPFLACSQCGPRFTIAVSAPLDRERTTMAQFTLCPECRREYADPGDRRFHAQPIACSRCGPRAELLDADGGALHVPDPVAAAAGLLRNGLVGAIKGLGGFHLACDAGSPDAVRRLRLAKRRDRKPFAILAPDLDRALELCHISPAESRALLSPQRPIVLLRRRAGAPVAEEAAPGQDCLGVFLAYTPLHHLLLADFGGRPLVLTSANFSDEPMVTDNRRAVEKLRGMADFFLAHDRPIRSRCDDSICRVAGGEELPLRRSRGHAPRPILMPVECPAPILALGGQLKAAFSLGRGREAILSHHLGDLDSLEGRRAYTEAILHYERLFRIRPQILACDLHPDYLSSRHAVERQHAEGTEPRHAEMQLFRIQHHHAHIASCMAENGAAGPVIGVAFDGSGLGDDGAVWGGEFLIAGYTDYRRAAHLRYVRAPGGDSAMREPWRMAAAHLLDAGESLERLREHAPAAALRSAERQSKAGFNAPWTSSAGRLFDAVAAIIGLRLRSEYEGQAASELEAAAGGIAEPEGSGFRLDTESGFPETGPLEIDTRPLIRAVARAARDGASAASISRRFHGALAASIAGVCGGIRASTSIGTVVLSGGVFQNALLLTGTEALLLAAGFRVLRHRLAPPNDGGLSLGQLAIAAARASLKGAPACA